jgi:hypothetical protein
VTERSKLLFLHSSLVVGQTSVVQNSAHSPPSCPQPSNAVTYGSMNNLKKLEKKEAINRILKATKPKTSSFPAKIERLAYMIQVSTGSGEEVLTCISYFLSKARRHRGLEFQQYITNFPRCALPTGRQANFKEELLATGFAAEVSAGAAVTPETLIKQKMAEVYGNNAKVVIEPLPSRIAAIEKQAEDS